MKKLKKGMEFKNYREVFEYLELKDEKGDTRVKNKKILDSLCKYEQKGNKIIITRVFKEQKEIVDKRRDNGNKPNLNLKMAYLILNKLSCFRGVDYYGKDDFPFDHYVIQNIFKEILNTKISVDLYNMYMEKDNKAISYTDGLVIQMFETVMKSYIRRYIQYGLNYLHKVNIIRDLKERYICEYLDEYNEEKKKAVESKDEMIFYDDEEIEFDEDWMEEFDKFSDKEFEKENINFSEEDIEIQYCKDMEKEFFNKTKNTFFCSEEYEKLISEISKEIGIKSKNLYMVDKERKKYIYIKAQRCLCDKYEIVITKIYKAWCFDINSYHNIEEYIDMQKHFENIDIEVIQKEIIIKIYTDAKKHFENMLEKLLKNENERFQQYVGELEIKDFDTFIHETWGEQYLTKKEKIYILNYIMYVKNISRIDSILNEIS